MQFFHVFYSMADRWGLEQNKSREEALIENVCPFLTREVTLHRAEMLNAGAFTVMKVYRTDQPIDAMWPVKNPDDPHRWQGALSDFFDQNPEMNVTDELFREAIILIDEGGYKERRREISESLKGKTSFMVCPFGNDEVDRNYSEVIKPTIEAHGFEIKRVDEIMHTQEITDVIIERVNQSRFIVADLTEAKPNCYYEVGYAHAVGKPVIILAKTGTSPQFDISTYRWNFWKDTDHLRVTFTDLLEGVLRNLGLLS